MKNIFCKKIYSISRSAFILTMITVLFSAITSVGYAEFFVAESIAPQSVFIPLNNPEIKDIAMLEYTLLDGIESDKMQNLMVEGRSLTNMDLGIDFGIEDVNTRFLFNEAVNHYSFEIRIVPCFVENGGRKTKYWCCIYGARRSGDEEDRYKFTFFTEKERKLRDFTNNILIYKYIKRIKENDTIEKMIKSEQDHDEKIRRAIFNDKYFTIEENHSVGRVPLVFIKSFLNAIIGDNFSEENLSSDFTRLVEAGQLMIITEDDPDNTLTEMHAGGRGIYLPYYINDNNIFNAVVRGIFVKAGFSCEDSNLFQNIFVRYCSKKIKSGLVSNEHSDADILLSVVRSDAERELVQLAKAARFLNFTDEKIDFEKIKNRDYSSEKKSQDENVFNFLNVLPVGTGLVVEKNGVFSILWANKMFATMLGHEGEYVVVGRDLKDIVKEKRTQVLSDWEQRVLSGKEVFPSSCKVLAMCNDGTEIGLEVSVDWFMDTEHYIITAVDVTKYLYDRREKDELRDDLRELDCLEQLVKLSQDPEILIEQVFIAFKDYVKEAFTDPDRTHVRIRYDGKEFSTDGFEETEFQVLEDIKVKGVKVGDLTVGYVSENEKSGSFSKTEIKLVSIIARRFSEMIVSKNEQKELLYLARYDSLTGIYNRVKFEDALEKEIGRSRRTNEIFSLCFFDLNDFKVVNDSFGHEAGDYVLKEVAKRVKGSLRANEMFARVGGDEFVFIITQVEQREHVEIVLERIFEKIEKEPFVFNGHDLDVSISVGVSFFNQEDALDEKSLIAQADRAMYKAKEISQGRNKFCLFDDTIVNMSDKSRGSLLRRLQTLFDFIPDGVHTVDTDGIILEVNQKESELLGYSIEEMVGKSIFDFIHPEEREEARGRFILKLKNQQFKKSVPRKYAKKDGTYIVCSATDSIEYDADGRAIRVITALRDITEINEQNVLIRQNKIFSHTVLNRMEASIAVVDVKTFEIVYANEAFYGNEGNMSRKVVDNECLKFLSGESMEGEYPDPNTCCARRSIETGETVTLEWEYINEDGLPGYLDITTHPTKDEDGKVVQIIYLVKDITERKMSEKKLFEEKEKHRKFIEFLSLGVYRANSNGDILQANLAMAKILGYDSPEELLKVPCAKLYQNPEDREKFIKETEEKGGVTKRRVLMKKKDGTNIVCQCTVVINHNGNDASDWTGVLEDVTAKEKALEVLRISEIKFSSVFKQIPTGMASFDENGWLTTINSDGLDIVGVDEEKQLEHCNLFWYLETVPNGKEIIQKMIRGEEVRFNTFIDLSIESDHFLFVPEGKSAEKRKGVLRLDFKIIPMGEGYVLIMWDVTRGNDVLDQIGDRSAEQSGSTAFDVQMISIDQTALIYGPNTKMGIVALRRVGFSGDVIMAKNEDELKVILDSDIQLDLIINTTSEDIKKLIEKIMTGLYKCPRIINDISNTHILQEELIEICA
ncbi:MAG: PAS domain S-box protein [Candidatus Omnitrophica bacterium]|nr:PAS domain S-box protein [Candidatus Omnitrophota bacterium]